MKYTVACLVPKEISEMMAIACSGVVDKTQLSENMHISLTYPFTIQDAYSEEWVMRKLNEQSFESIHTKLSKVGIFEQKNNLLYVSVEPSETYFDYHKNINMNLKDGIEIDNSAFLSGELPEYKPHIGIDYDFEGDLESIKPIENKLVEEWFESGQPLLFGFDEKSFIQVLPKKI